MPTDENLRAPHGVKTLDILVVDALHGEKLCKFLKATNPVLTIDYAKSFDDALEKSKVARVILLGHQLDQGEFTRRRAFDGVKLLKYVANSNFITPKPVMMLFSPHWDGNMHMPTDITYGHIMLNKTDVISLIDNGVYDDHKLTSLCTMLQKALQGFQEEHNDRRSTDS